MKSFSQRIGKTEVKNSIQKESMDERLRNGLWNALNFHYWNLISENSIKSNNIDIQTLLIKIWIQYFGNRIDEMSSYFGVYNAFIKKYFFSCEWYKVYNFIEFISNNYEDKFERKINENFREYCNFILEQELSAFRFINGIITPITSKEEIETIKDAMQMDDDFISVRIHLDAALSLFSDKKSPDYRNSIKESISAIESFCVLITDNPKATLGDALRKVEQDMKIHKSLKNAFNNLYGYTSDSNGIRHGLLESPNLNQEDARFMLIICSAFINYLQQKNMRNS